MRKFALLSVIYITLVFAISKCNSSRNAEMTEATSVENASNQVLRSSSNLPETIDTPATDSQPQTNDPNELETDLDISTAQKLLKIEDLPPVVLGQTPIPDNMKAMVVSANPHATRAGLAILENGGSAIDAAIAVQATLGLVEPQSSGLGGGAFLLTYDSKTGEVWNYDGRETAPKAITPSCF